jgi:anti-sigma-K factor RskA
VTAACESCRDLIGGYVLDALEPEERALVRRHIETCEPCAREHAELAAIPALLDVADSADAVPLRPPDRLEEAVLDRFARESRGVRPARRRRGWQAVHGTRLRARSVVPAAAALACALAAVAVVLAVGGGDDGAGDRGGDASAGAAAETARVYRIAMAGSGPFPGASGHARLYPGDTGTGVHLRVSGLEPRSYDYELWCVRDDGWKVSAGTFRVDRDGKAEVRLTTSAKPTEYDALAIQARPAGRGAGTSGPRVLVGRIRS